MVHIPAWLLIGLLELIVVFAALWVVWFIKWRALRRQLAVLQNNNGPTLLEHGRGAATYLSEEFIATRAYLDTREESEEAAPWALTLRAAYLEIEREIAEHGVRDGAFWTTLETRLATLPLPEAAPPVSALSASAVTENEVAGDDPQRFQRLIDAQVSTISDLKDALAALLGEGEAGTDMLAQVDKLGRTNREMAMCVSILEDDNNFLREKLKQAGLDIN